jgi:CheY-like chemotaxis protein
MFDNDYALTGATTLTPDNRTEFDDAPPVLNLRKRTVPLSPHQGFAKRSIKSSGSLRLVGRKNKPRSLQKHVLVVDDVHDVTEMIALFLKHAGYQVATADSASTALQLAEERNFDLIISDIGMPQMNGYELAGELRRLSEYQSIPIIAVTGYSEYDDRSRALQAGFSAQLTKPIDPSQLLDLMNELLG